MSHLLYKIRWFILSIVEKLNIKFSTVGDSDFFETNQFNWPKLLEQNHNQILAEFYKVYESQQLPNIQDITPGNSFLSTDNKWKIFGLYAYGYKVEDNCAKFPLTVALLEQIKGLRGAFFSILAEKKHIPEHRGPFNGILRYHLGLQIPEDNSCKIRVGKTMCYWKKGQSFIFSEGYKHEAWNDSDQVRVVLIIDFERPVYSPFQLINKLAIRYIESRPFAIFAKKKLVELSNQ